MDVAAPGGTQSVSAPAIKHTCKPQDSQDTVKMLWNHFSFCPVLFYLMDCVTLFFVFHNFNKLSSWNILDILDQTFLKVFTLHSSMTD